MSVNIEEQALDAQETSLKLNEENALKLRLIAKAFKALGDPTRLRLLEFISKGERSVSECQEALGIPQARASVHLSCLLNCGFLSVRYSGRYSYFSISDPSVIEIVQIATNLVAKNAYSIAACTRV